MRPALKPFEELCPRIQLRGRSLFAFSSLPNKMPDERQEIRIKRPASHTMLLAFYFYTIVIRWTQGVVYEVESGGGGQSASKPRGVGNSADDSNNRCKAVPLVV